MESKATRPLAVVTGASSGIGYHLARCALDHGHDLLVAADMPLGPAMNDFSALDPDASIEGVQADLSGRQGVDQLTQALRGRPVDILIANAGHGLGGAFLDQDFDEIEHVIGTNVTGTLYLLHQVARQMKQRRSGRILVTGSIAGFQPGAFQAVYNGTKAFVDSFVAALRNEMKDTQVSITCLMPGVTDTDFFIRADMLDTKVGAVRFVLSHHRRFPHMKRASILIGAAADAVRCPACPSPMPGPARPGLAVLHPGGPRNLHCVARLPGARAAGAAAAARPPGTSAAVP